MRWHDPFNRCPKPEPKPRPKWTPEPKYWPKKGTKWPLMPRQKLILHLYNIGLTSREVAKILGIRLYTLYTHLDRIYYKLEVHTRGDAIEKGLQR